MYCEYRPCQNSAHTILTYNMVTAWCQFCENRGHLPAHHKEYDQIRLINMYLAAEAFNLKTGFKLLTGGKEDFQRIKYVHWRCGLYTSSKEEVPKYHRMQPEWDTSHLGEPEKPAGPDPKRQLNKRIYDLQLKLRTGCTYDKKKPLWQGYMTPQILQPRQLLHRGHHLRHRKSQRPSSTRHSGKSGSAPQRLIKSTKATVFGIMIGFGPLRLRIVCRNCPSKVRSPRYFRSWDPSSGNTAGLVRLLLQLKKRGWQPLWHAPLRNRRIPP